MVAAGVDEIYQNNLSLIRQIYPQYIPLLESVPEKSEYAMEMLRPRTYSCREANGNWLHGPDDPWKSASQTIQSTDWRSPRLFLVMRPGLGYIPLTLYPNLRKGHSAQRLWIVEDRIDLFKESLRRLDWTDTLRSDRVLLLLNSKPLEAIYEFVQMNPVVMLSPMNVFLGTKENPRDLKLMQDLQTMLNKLAGTVHNAAQEYFADLKKHYEETSKTPSRSKKILMVEPEHDYLADSLAEGMREAGCVPETYQANRRLLNFLNSYIWLVYVREHFPDVLLWMNRNTLSNEGAQMLAQIPIKKVLWFLDSPKRVETSAEELAATDAYFSFDPSYLPYLEELSGKKGYYLPTAAGIKPLPECRPGAAWPERQGPPVSFMGALAAARFQEVRSYWLLRDPDFVRLLDQLVDDYLANPAISLEERFEASPGRERLPYRGFVVLYLEESATYRRRLEYLKPLPRYGLKTYGALEWGREELARELTPCYAGYAPKYQEELPLVYYHSQININVFHAQCVNSTNPRVYDVLAAGGFLLTEYRPAIEEEFEIGRHLDCFCNEAELVEKVEYYLSHPEQREQIAREGQSFVLRHATYRHRVEEILLQLNR